MINGLQEKENSLFISSFLLLLVIFTIIFRLALHSLYRFLYMVERNILHEF